MLIFLRITQKIVAIYNKDRGMGKFSKLPQPCVIWINKEWNYIDIEGFQKSIPKP